MRYYCGQAIGDTFLGIIRGTNILIYRNSDWEYYMLYTNGFTKKITDYDLLLNIRECFKYTCSSIPSIDEFLKNK